jgi:2-methylcitrate dehydratase PrpD
MTTLESIARWAAELQLSDIPERVIEKARWQQASVLAASFAGLNDPAARKVVQAARAGGGSGDARVLAAGFRTARPSAVFANASVSCTFDYDEILLLGHPGHSTVTVPLMLGEALGKSWGEVVAAQVAANEVAGRFGLCSVLSPQNGQMIPYLHCAGAAVAAGRLFGLDASRMAHALAVALAQPPAALWPSFLGSIDVKVIIAAHGTAMGVHAAELAAQGFTGALDLLDHPRGFFHRFTFVALRRPLTGLGRAWVSDTLQVKLHAACWYYQALLDALAAAGRSLEAARGRPLRASDVKQMTCRTTFLAEGVNAMERVRPRQRLTANEVNFSIPIAAAVLLLRGRLVPDDLGEESLSALEAEARALASKIRVVHDAALTRRLLATLDESVDIPGLLGSASLSELTRGVRRLKNEFPHAGALHPTQLARYLTRAPAIVGKLLRGQKAEYDLGARDLSRLIVPISAGFELELADGTKIEGERDVEEGALSLPGAPALAAQKLRMATRATLGSGGADRLCAAIERARPDTPVADLLAAAAPLAAA